MFGSDLASNLVLFLYGFVFYKFTIIIYRLWLHPLSNFPGPRLAAVSSLYSFYFNVVRGGLFIWEIQRMHRQYGKSRIFSPNKPKTREVIIETPH